MRRLILLCIIMLLSNFTLAQKEVTLELEQAPIDIHDKTSIARGAKFFATNCMVCHTLIYLRYNNVAKDAGILYEKMPINVKEWPFGIKPPDLSLEVSRRGANWVYTYLHSFYSDKSRPTGVNNLLFNNTAMAGILMAYQGQQILLPFEKWPQQIYSQTYHWYDLLQSQTEGSMTQTEFDATIADVVNFLAYAAEPYKIEQEKLGVWVIGYLIILFILVFWLKREYWKKLEK